MNKNINYKKLLSSNLKNFESYSSGASLPDTIKKFGLNIEDIIKIDANENVFIDPSWHQEQLQKCLSAINLARYPDPLYIETRKSLADYFNLHYEEILVGNGSDDVFMAIYHAFVDQKSEVLVAEPTFSMYKFFADILGGRYSYVLLNDDFTLNVDKLLAKVTPKTKLMIIASPNNPTGNTFETEKIKELIEKFNGIFILDEAYAAYSDVSLIKWIKKYGNLIVIRTFSKSLGLAGLRVGIMALNKELAKIIQPLQIPYAFNIVAQHLVPQLLKEKEYFKNKIEEVKRERDWLISKLSEIKNLKVYPSKTNFILVRILKKNMDAKDLCIELLKTCIIIRDRSTVPLLENCVRITVGTREINLKLLENLKKILEK